MDMVIKFKQNAFRWLELIFEEMGIDKKTPLSTKILDQLVDIAPKGVSKEELSIALNSWTTSDEYLKAIVDGAFTHYRFNLDRTEDEELKPHHRAYARGILDERKRQMAARKRKFQDNNKQGRKLGIRPTQRRGD